MMIQPELETDILLAKLVPSMEDSTIILSEFEIRSIIHKARRLPDRHEGLLVEGLACLVSERIEEGIELCERSVSLDKSDHVAWLNYALTMASRGYHALHREIIVRAMSYDLTEVYLRALFSGAFWVDPDIFYRSYNYLTKTGVLESALSPEQKIQVDFMLNLKPNMDFIAPIAKVAFEVADAERLVASSGHVAGDDENGIFYALSVRNVDAQRLLELNDLLVEKMIDRNLLSTNCVAIIISEGN